MPIQSDDELEAAVLRAGDLLEEIETYIGARVHRVKTH